MPKIPGWEKVADTKVLLKYKYEADPRFHIEIEKQRYGWVVKGRKPGSDEYFHQGVYDKKYARSVMMAVMRRNP